MLKDVSDWVNIGHGGKSTLEKEELKSPIPTEWKYMIKYPRESIHGTYWEDITELIAAKIGAMMGLETMEVEIVTRLDRRGCLLRNFVEASGAKMHEEGGALLPNLVNGYDKLQQSTLKNKELIEEGFAVITQLDYWGVIKSQYIDMLIFDIFIGNQDRHPYNWMILFFNREIRFSPIYDNGASLGFNFNNEKLQEMNASETKINRYVRNTRVKAGLFERTHVKAKDLLTYIKSYYPNELEESIKKIERFDIGKYNHYIQSEELLSVEQKKWLTRIIPVRKAKIFEWLQEKEDYNE